ncbi:carboxylate--amine ligase [Halorussus halobius]|uniref:carboxylate--amine ligase n=1 Tax=Halorussus halobius TaxID=1710537 RepID=UPI001092B20C|nr:hypothetical protein [Halorussus halobius]
MTAEDDFIQYLLEIGEFQEDKPVLFPTNDQWAMAVSKHKEDLSKHYRLCVADWPVVNKLIHKQQFYDWATKREYPVPRSWDTEERIPDDAFPVAAKPEYRRVSSDKPSTETLSQKFDEMRLEILEDRHEVQEFKDENENVLQYFIFQEYVRGLSNRMYTIGIYADENSEVLGMFTGRKLRGFPPDIGDCKLGQAENLPSSLKTMVKELCRDLGYTGIAEFEFKRDEVTGKFKLIEINPRSWSWVGITPSCGVSLPWIAYADLKGIGDISYTENTVSTGEVKWVRLLEDSINCLYKNERAGYPEWDMTFAEWCQSIRASKTVTAEFDIRDPAPGLYSVYKFMRSNGGQLKRKYLGET